MALLSDQLHIEARFARSTNIERDINQSQPLNGYLVTARALDVIERITSVASNGAAGDAWSIVGPYGSGKSSLAVLLDALFGPKGRLRQQALELLALTSPETAQQLEAAHDAYGTQSTGFVRALVTADREPVSHTLLRALHDATTRHFGDIPEGQEFAAAQTLEHALRTAHSSDARLTGPSAADIVEIATALTEHAPLLIVIDEFGKNLEAIGESRESREADPYFLQQLAEAGQGTGRPIYLLTLQHLAFEDYAMASADEIQQKEWAKVQGRFEDVPYIDSPTQTRALISTVFSVTDSPLRQRIDSWAAEKQTDAASLGTPDLHDPARIAACYPLHPLTAAVLPDLCKEFGQNERTLFSFLTGPGPTAVPSFLQQEASAALPSVGLERVYDYFMSSGVLASSRDLLGRRWNEITTRLNDAHDLNDNQLALAKTIAVLNLAPAGGTIRASVAILETVFGDTLNTLVASLETQKLIAFREFADEYRIWAGSDAPIESLLEAELQYWETRVAPIDLLNEAHPVEEVVAARHSAQFETLRVFRRRYVAAGSNDVAIEPPDALDERTDGELLLVIGQTDDPLPKLENQSYSKPVVAVVPHDTTRLIRAAQTKAALLAISQHQLIASDRVAKREISERLAEAHAEFIKQFDITFDATNCDWHWLNDETQLELCTGRGTSVLSDVCDAAYSQTPTLRSEMLNRFKLTSQGARARRLLLEAMIEHGDKESLGFEGYGPEMAMYRSVLEATGIHRPNSKSDATYFGPPADNVDGNSGLANAWRTLESQFNEARSRRVNLNDVYAGLMSPPVGMKVGAIPVLLTAALLTYRNEIAIYEHGTFVPVLEPPISERMVRNPAHFDVKHFANSSGGRLGLLESLADGLEISNLLERHRVSNVLSVVTAVVRRFGALDNYTKRTQTLHPEWAAFRLALTEAVEPDVLVFESIPRAFGLPSVPADGDLYEHTDELVGKVGEALAGLTATSQQMLLRLVEVLVEESAVSNAQALARIAVSLDRDLVESLESDLRAFVYALSEHVDDTGIELMKHLATVVSRKDCADWTDDDVVRFERFQLPEVCASFRRTLALHAQISVDEHAVNVVFTRPDGTEDHRVVSHNSEQRSAATKAVAEAVEQLEDLYGSRQAALDGVLGAIADDLIPPDGDNRN